jgi:hypothetical protein
VHSVCPDDYQIYRSSELYVLIILSNIGQMSFMS